MGFVIFICIAVVIALIVVFVGAPLRSAREDTTSREPSACRNGILALARCGRWQP